MSRFWDDELCHYGTPNMKWGRRLYQYEDGSLTPLGRLRYGKEKSNQINAMAKARKAKADKAAAQKAADEKAKVEAEEKENYEANKQKALKSGTAADVLQYKGDLTNTELQSAIDRINKEKTLSDIAAADVKSGWEKADAIVAKAKKVTDYVDTGSKLYNSTAKVVNTFNKDGKKLPLINLGGGDNQKKK